MNKIYAAILIAGFGISTMAQDQESRIAALERDYAKLQSDLEALQEKQAGGENLTLTQDIQWGKGLGLDLSSGARGQPAEASLGILSPKFGNTLSLDLRAYLMAVHDWRVLSDSTKEYYTYMLQLAPRVALWTPMFFNFTRAYAGVEGTLTGLLGGVAGNAGRYALGVNVLVGMEFYLARRLSVFAEAGGMVFEPFYIVPVKDYSVIENARGGSVAIGVRFYLGK
ncbi:MAG: hypothetical protein WCQ50_13450 [Spirochaetota bacterium]